MSYLTQCALGIGEPGGAGVGGGDGYSDGDDNDDYDGDRQGGHDPPADVEEAEAGHHQPLLQLHPTQVWARVYRGHLSGEPIEAPALQSFNFSIFQ